jgi:PAS domain S-box-containing protein
MGPALHILSVEDDPKDTELLHELLQTEGVICEVTRVDTEPLFLSSLERGGIDLILADYTLPAFDGLSALKLAVRLCPEVPFIFVSGTLGEEFAIEALKIGATDYVLKTQLSKLAPAVARALAESRQRVERKEAAEKLRESEAYLAEAQRLSQTGSWAWNMATGDIRYWSEECFRVLGFDPLGPLPRFEEFLTHFHPDDRDETVERFEQAIRDKADFELDHRVVHPQRGVRDIHVVGHAVVARCGDLIEFVGTVIDVTDRKRAEKELQHLVDFVPHIIVVFDPDGRWIHVNRVAREYTGLAPEEYQGIDAIGRVVHPEDVETVRARRTQGFCGAEPFEQEARVLGKDGVYRWFLFRYNPLIEDGRVRRWYGTATEIESRKQEEERVRKENVRLEERTRIARELHDTLLQTFLGASMMLDMAVDRLPPNSPVQSQLDRILKVMKEGIEEGRKAIHDLRLADARTSDLVEALSQVRQEFAVQSGVDFHIEVIGSQAPMRPLVWHESYRIGREALLNAFRHSQATRIELEFEYADDDLRVSIRDNGCGIDPRILHSGCDGHWGLAGMRERAARIGGRLDIASSATGTEVELSIPCRLAIQLSPSEYEPVPEDAVSPDLLS